MICQRLIGTVTVGVRLLATQHFGPYLSEVIGTVECTSSALGGKLYIKLSLWPISTSGPCAN